MKRHPLLFALFILGIGLLLPGVAFSASANVLLIVSDSAAPDQSDLDLAAFLATYGLTTFYADDDDSEATYNSIISTNNIDAVYISTSVGSSRLSDKARDLTVGGVTANGGSWDNMLLHCSGSSTQTDGTDINLVDNSHFITQPFSTGNFSAYTGTGSLGWGDNLGSGAQVLAQMPGQPTQGSIVAYETGSLLCGGTPPPAPARRVGIYTDDDFSLWSMTTKILVLRSILWAAGSGASLAAATSAVAEISPNAVTTGASGNAFTYDILVTLGGATAGLIASKLRCREPTEPPRSTTYW